MSEKDVIEELENMLKLNNEDTPCLNSEKAIIIKRTTAENILRILKIKDEYMRLAKGLLYDYDGYYNGKTKKGDIEALAELIDEAVEHLELALKCDDKKDIYVNGVDGNKRFNILLEEIKEEKKMSEEEAKELLKYCSLIKTVLNMLEEDKRKLKIKDEYMKLALDLMFEYDGYYDEETKRGDIEGLAELIDETVKYLKFALNCNDKKDIYNIGNKKFNILFEEIEEDSQ